MPSEIIEIRIRQIGAQQAAQQIQGIGASARQSASSVDFLHKVFRGFLALQLAQRVATIADEFTNLNNRVRVFSNSNAEATKSVRGLVDVALRARQSLTAAGEVFQRFSIAGKEAGLSTDEILRFTETLLKATTVSGATAQEAEGALRQLLQGFSANRLSGQELNSVLEQTPIIAALIAKQVGVGVGQLRVLANQSKATAVITRDVLIKALREGGAEIEAMFARTNVTYGQALTNLGTALAVIIGETNRLGSVIGKIPAIINGAALALARLAQNETVSMLAAAALNSTLVALAIRVLPLVIRLAGGAALAFIRLFTALSPLGRAITVVVGALTLFGDSTLKIRGFETTILDLAAVIGGDLVAAVKRGLTAVRDFFNFDPATSALGRFIQKTIDFAGTLIPDDVLARASARTRERRKETPGTGIGGPAKDLEIQTREMQRLNDLLQDFNVLQSSFDVDPFKRAEAEIDKQVTDITQRFDDLVKAGKISASALKAVGESIRSLRFEEQRQELRDFVSEFDPIFAVQDKLRQNLRALEENRSRGELTTGVDFTRLVAEQELAADRALLDLRSKQQENTTAFSDGAKLAIVQFRETLGTETELIATAFTGLFSRASDALTEFLTTGKFNFKDFARSVIGDIIGIITKILLLKAIQGIGNAIGGGTGALISGVVGGVAGAKALGGPVSRGSSYMVGERGPELFTPPSTGNIVPNDRLQSSSNVTIVNVLDQAEVARMIGSAEGEKAILNTISRNRGRVKQSVTG